MFHHRPMILLSMILASAEALSNCGGELQTDLGGLMHTMDASTNLSIVGFDASVTYVKDPSNAATRTLTITSASVAPILIAEEGLVTIQPEKCSDSPESSAFRLGPLLLPFVARNGVGSTAFAAVMLALTIPFADAAEECMPMLEIEITVPYDCRYNNVVNGRCMTPTQIADQAVQALFVDKDTEAAGKLLADDYIQHNPFVPTGKAPVIGFIPTFAEFGLEIEVHRTFAQDNLVAYHSTYTNADVFGLNASTLIGFDVFRVENGLVQEHWDNLQAQTGPNPSGNSMVDGPTMVKHMGETAANKALVLDLVETVLIGGNITAIPLFISSETYTQHNPDIADGLTGLFEGFAALAEAGLNLIYKSVELVVAEGNFVLVGSLGEYGVGNPTAYYDMFRVDEGKIVEHWDVIQAVPAEQDFAHANGKF